MQVLRLLLVVQVIDTINAASFDTDLEINAGSGADVITTQSGALDLNVDAGAGDDSITVTGSDVRRS